MIARFTIAVALLALSSIAIAQEPTAEPAAESAAVSTTDPTADPTTDQPSASTATSPTAEPASSEEPATASEATTTDSDERAAKLKELLTLVQDNTTKIHKRENPAYFMLMKDVIDRTPEQLRQEITINPRFNDLYQKPSEYRGQLVNVKLNARRVLPIDFQSRNAAGVTRMYEIWGWTAEAKAWMYCCVVPELPPGFPEEGDIMEYIELTGYFFKMQAYQPGNAAPNARNLVAPLIIGRIVSANPIQAKSDGSMGYWPLIIIVGFASIVMFRLLMHVRGMNRTPPVRRNYRRRSLEPTDPDAIDDALNTPNRGLKIRNLNEV